MLYTYTPFPSDLIFTRNPRLIGKIIRWATRGKNEPATYTNHVAGVSVRGMVIEALWHVQSTPLEQWMGENPAFQVWRNTRFPAASLRVVATEAVRYVGKHYGWWKLGAHLLDGMIAKVFSGDVYLVRRMLFMKRYPICSWVWAYSYSLIGARFGCGPECADPDTMHDYVSSSKEWEKVFERS